MCIYEYVVECLGYPNFALLNKEQQDNIAILVLNLYLNNKNNIEY